MADVVAITGRDRDSTEGLIQDGRRLFYVLSELLEGGASDTEDRIRGDALFMLASMGRDFMDEAARVWDRERRR